MQKRVGCEDVREPFYSAARRRGSEKTDEDEDEEGEPAEEDREMPAPPSISVSAHAEQA